MSKKRKRKLKGYSICFRMPRVECDGRDRRGTVNFKVFELSRFLILSTNIWHSRSLRTSSTTWRSQEVALGGHPMGKSHSLTHGECRRHGWHLRHPLRQPFSPHNCRKDVPLLHLSLLRRALGHTYRTQMRYSLSGRLLK